MSGTLTVHKFGDPCDFDYTVTLEFDDEKWELVVKPDTTYSLTKYETQEVTKLDDDGNVMFDNDGEPICEEKTVKLDAFMPPWFDNKSVVDGRAKRATANNVLRALKRKERKVETG